MQLTFAALTFPAVNPVAVEIGPFVVRWYALAYVAGLTFAFWYMKRLVRQPRLWGAVGAPIDAAGLDDLFLWGVLGVVLGGRAGYVLFYDFPRFADDPMEIFRVWHGGMSFHGGFLGVIAACWAFGRRRGIRLDRLLDLGAASVPVGLGLGRLANFINGELFGRPSDVPWAMVFPGGGPLPRHPSQLYEFLLEGAILFLAVRLASHRFGALAQPGRAAGVFACGYALSRIAVEFFREPDPQIGYLVGPVTLGMVLSLPLLTVGIWLLTRKLPQ